MSSESVGANEFPDVVGVKAAKADNPLLATFRPYIPASTHIRELTVLPLVVGTLLGMVFGASSLWLVLKVGLTVSASIPVAVISISLFRLLGKIGVRSEEHTSELQSQSNLVCRLLLEKKKNKNK